MAVFDSGRSGPAVSFSAEYDALKGIGHACGHNLIAIASIGAALVTAEMMREHALNGRVVLFGTPAEVGRHLFAQLSIWSCRSIFLVAR